MGCSVVIFRSCFCLPDDARMLVWVVLCLMPLHWDGPWMCVQGHLKVFGHPGRGVAMIPSWTW